MIKLTENQREILQGLLDGKEIEVYNNGTWCDFTHFKTPLNHLYNDEKLRIKPRTIIVNGVEVPEPMKVKPENDTQYYTAAPNPGLPLIWFNDGCDNEYLTAGICHSTPEAAVLHWEAMIKPSKIVQE